MKIMEPWQEIPYTVKYAILPSNSIENKMCPTEDMIKEQNEENEFFIQLEKSILEGGIVNPVGIVAKENEVYITYGGSRLMIAQKHNMDIPCIIADFDNVFPKAKVITEEEVASYFKNPPTHFQLRTVKLYIHGCEDIHLKKEKPAKEQPIQQPLQENKIDIPECKNIQHATYNVVCVKWGPKYGPEYVNILQAMVKRNLSLPHRFICFTDDNTGLNPGIETFPLTETNLEGWWHKLTLFKSNLFGLEGRTLYLDLDVVIVDSIDCFFNNYDDRFVIIKDWNSRPNKIFWNSSVFVYDVGKLSFVWDTYTGDKCRRLGGGDQIWITKQIPDATNWPSTWCRSFKYECKEGVPEGCKIVIFHGQPNPPEALAGKILTYPAAPWIADYWKE